MIYNEVDINEENEIVSVSDFIQKIKDLKDNAEGVSTVFYFRGQKAEFWDIEPSIFRNDMISIEHELMQIPLTKVPGEFRSFNSMFEVMTKYQHYGMCTRLLDLTTNPLVALYFACEQHGNVQYNGDEEVVEKEPYGVIYYSDSFYPTQANDKEVAIVSALAKYNLSKDNSFKTILKKLKGEGIITSDEEYRWLDEAYASAFVDIIQNNYMVVPTYTNDRLQRQSGVFLLASMFNIDTNLNIVESVLSKGRGSLRNEFAKHCFYIKGENKTEILKELDLYNINEATLFPELEHQLNHIRNTKKFSAEPVADFSKYEQGTVETSQIKGIYVDSHELSSFITKNFDVAFFEIIDGNDIEEVKSIIVKHFTIDWYNRQPALSKMKRALTSYYLEKSDVKDKELSKKKASEIMDKLEELVKEFMAA